MTRRLIAVCGCLLGLVVADARADCPELVGRWPYGPAFAVAASGDYAYFTSGAALMVADVSDPSAPRVVGDVTLPDIGTDIAVSGRYVFVADGGSGLRVVDVGTPPAPVEVGFVATGSPASNVAVGGGRAYVLTEGSLHTPPGLEVINVNAPSSPRALGFLALGERGFGVAASGDFVYIAAGDSGLRVIDASIPSQPEEVTFVDLPGYTTGVAVSGGFAYVIGDYGGGLRVIDVSAPSAPRVVGSMERSGDGMIAVSGDHAYFTLRSTLWVADVSEPSAPRYVDSVRLDVANAIAVSGEYLFVADGGSGLVVVDVGTPSESRVVGAVGTPGRAEGVALAAGHAYVVDHEYGLRVIRMTTPSEPEEVGFVESIAAGNSTRVAVSNGYAYVARYLAGLSVMNVRVPSAPTEVGTLRSVAFASGVAVSGDYAYVTVQDLRDPSLGPSGLRVIDLSTPSAPVEVGRWEGGREPNDVAVSGGYAYVADSIGGLWVIDVRVPSAPTEVGFIDTSDWAWDVAVADGFAYVAAQGAGLRVIDISTPSAPAEVGFVDDHGWPGDDCTAVAVSGGYAYVVDQIRGLRVIDVGDPTAPLEVGSYPTAGTTEMAVWSFGRFDVAVSRGHVVLADCDAGLYIFRECGGGQAPDAGSSFLPAAALAAGAEGAFFSTDVEINNKGAEEAEFSLQWLPRGRNNTEPVSSDLFALAPGASLRFENVLTSAFGLGPDSLGALKMVASTDSVIGMSRTYNSPGGKAAATFGQGLPSVRATEMIEGTAPQRIIFLSEDDDSRANVGCVNGGSDPLSINIGIFDDEGSLLETRTMNLGPWSNNQLNRVFEEYAPVNGYVDVWGDNEDAIFTCYGSMLDNETSDPTTILPQVPSSDTIFIPAAALAAGLEGAFFTTDLDLNNVGSDDITYELLWLPRGADNTDAVRSDTFSLAAGSGVRYANVLGEVFGLEPDQVGALEIEASGAGLLAMSRTYNTPSA